MSKKYSPQIMEAIEFFLKKGEWNYELIEERGVIRMGIALDSKLKTADIRINVMEKGFCVDTILRIGADDESKAAMAEFLARANFGLSYGHFEMDYDEGDMLYHTSFYAGDTVPTYEQIEHTIYINISTLDNYGNALTKALYGVAAPKDAIAECENG